MVQKLYGMDPPLLYTLPKERKVRASLVCEHTPK